MKKTITVTALIASLALSACKTTNERPNIELSGSMANDAYTCQGNETECYADAARICGDLGYEMIRDHGLRDVSTAGRATGNPRLDDPFGTVRRETGRTTSTLPSDRVPLRFRCLEE